MCGIAGYCLNKEVLPSAPLIEGFRKSIRKRGPDDEGVSLISRSKGRFLDYRNDFKHDVALIHSRFAILDLSSKGHQPFVSADQSVVGVFNGEIYNYIELRKELLSLGRNFHTGCDTEVLIEGYAQWRDELWPRLNGFWAVVLFDKKDHSLVFSRDRMGVAPLYYRQTSQGVYFSSYIEPLLEIEGIKVSLNEDAILGFAQTGYKDLEYTTFYAEIKSLPAGSVLRLPCPQANLLDANIKSFWSLPSQRLKEKDISFDEAVKTFRSIFFDAVDIRLRADVKVAFELSGGLDSSSVVAAAAQLNRNRITTYTAKIKNADEEPFARSMLSKYHLDYQVVSQIEDDFAHDCPSFAKLMEEPFDNPNAYTHHHMLKIMEAQGVKVVMTGAGGDEVLAGYEASFWPKAYQEWRAQDLASYFKADWYEVCRRYKTWGKGISTIGNYTKGFLRKLMPGTNKARGVFPDIITKAQGYAAGYKQLFFDQQRRFHFTTALLPFYMRSSDHFTMGIPIEHRFPLLDYRLVDFGLRLPISFLFRNGWTKYILRKSMEPYLPSQIVWRREKMGFQFPFRKYLHQNSYVFSPLLEDCCNAFPCLRIRGGYAALLNQDPVLLWRLISIGLWHKGLKS